MARKRRRRNSRPDVYLAYAVVICAHLLLFWVLISKGLAHLPTQGTLYAANHREPTPVRPAMIKKLNRAIYPYSVIRTGAYSVAELQAALRIDPVAAAHYAVFDRSQMSITRAPHSAAVYVSYRQGDRVYWTRKKMHLAAEESLLTDGVHEARSRCGNRISLTPQEPTQASEPSAMDLDVPEAPPDVDATEAPVEDLEDVDDEELDLLSLPMLVVHEIFPAPLGTLILAGLPGDALGGMMVIAAPGGERFSGSRRVAPPLLAGLTLPPPAVVWPITFQTLPPQPVGPGFLQFQPTPLPGGYVTGSIPGPPPGLTVPRPAVPGLPSVPGGMPFPIPPGNTFLLPPALTFPPARPAGEPSSPVRLADVPLRPAAEVPEPATAALLLCGALLLAFRRRSKRHQNS